MPTLEEFALRFLEGYARANRQKPSTVSSKESILRVHLAPLLGTRKLDAITNEDVLKVKNHFHDRAATTANTLLKALSVVLKAVVEKVERPRATGAVPLALQRPEQRGSVNTVGQRVSSSIPR